MAELDKIAGDYFWDSEDREVSSDAPDDLIDERCGCGEIMEIERAVRLPNIFGFQIYSKAENEYTTHFFDTLDEAEVALVAFRRNDQTGGQGPSTELPAKETVTAIEGARRSTEGK